VFRRSTFLAGDAGDSKLPDVWWFRPDGRRMTRRNWDDGEERRVGVFLNGAELVDRTPHGERVVDDSFLLLFNADHEPAEFVLPPRRFGLRWLLELSTAEPDAEQARFGFRDRITLESRSLVVLRRET
jgi:glycogen operon protein